MRDELCLYLATIFNAFLEKETVPADELRETNITPTLNNLNVNQSANNRPSNYLKVIVVDKIFDY